MHTSSLRFRSHASQTTIRFRADQPVSMALSSRDADAQQRRLDQEDRLIAIGLLVCFAIQIVVLLV